MYPTKSSLCPEADVSTTEVGRISFFQSSVPEYIAFNVISDINDLDAPVSRLARSVLLFNFTSTRGGPTGSISCGASQAFPFISLVFFGPGSGWEI